MSFLLSTWDLNRDPKLNMGKTELLTFFPSEFLLPSSPNHFMAALFFIAQAETLILSFILLFFPLSCLPSKYVQNLTIFLPLHWDHSRHNLSLL